MTWRNYVLRTVGRDRNIDIHRKTGINEGTLSRWLSGKDNRGPSIGTIRSFAEAYERPFLEALIAAEVLTPEEAQVPPTDLRLIPDEVFIAEIVRRLASRAREPEYASA